MKKKKLIKWIVLGIIIGMIVPAPIKIKDGGTVIYKATLYQIIKVHRLNIQEEYDDGYIIKVFGKEIYNSLSSNNVNVKELEVSKKRIEENVNKQKYRNYVSSYIDDYKKEIIISLINNNKEEEEWFRKNIFDANYLEFKENNISILFMYIKENTLTNNSAKIIIGEYGKKTHSIDNKYYIEKNDNNEWKALNILSEPNWNNISFNVLEDGIIEQDLHWENYYGTLPIGKYRIVKETITSENQNEKAYTEFNIYE